ncbi:MAG TPA: hypothetical protein PK821_02015, partial [Victivallales bacterium]|nr:hypothetical protein [Victivallales bacterium]
MSKAVLFLADGMADEPMSELGGMTPLEYAKTPNMDKIAELGASGTFLSLPGDCPTSSDAANLSVLGYDLANSYPGRGPIEAASRNISLGKDDIAFRCNLIEEERGILKDYSAGQIKNEAAEKLIGILNRTLGSEKIIFHSGVSYRNILVLRGSEFSEKIVFAKPDSSQGEKISDLLPTAADDSLESKYTAETLRELIGKSKNILSNLQAHENNSGKANSIWPWSPGRKP